MVEVASRDFMDNLVSILKMPVLNLDVKNRILKLVQIWAKAFEGKPNLYYVGQVYKTMKTEGSLWNILTRFVSPDSLCQDSASHHWTTQLRAPQWSIRRLRLSG